jgi:hypothetical protein
LLLSACAPTIQTAGAQTGEHIRVLDLHPGVTATIVAPTSLDPRERVDLILYALPNGNTTAETIGRAAGDGVGWRYDIQHIGAQTRALRARGLPQAVVVYLEAETRSWPEWRRVHGPERASARISSIVDQLRYAIGNPAQLAVTLTGHSGGGSFAWGFFDGQDALPAWLERIAFLDSNYSFEYRHGEQLVKWLRGDARRTLVIVAYNDRNITVDGRKVVPADGGTYRATSRMMNYLREPFGFAIDTLGEFVRYHAPQIEVLVHPNPDNRILHTAMIGEMNAYMHALLVRRPGYDGESLLKPSRAYTDFIESEVVLPAPSPPEIPPRAAAALTGSAFIASLATLSRAEREAAILRELMAGNLPGFLRELRTVTINDTLGFEVMPDYLAIGSDDDFVRMPMQPYTAQAFADAFGFVLPTSKLVDEIWRAAEVKLEPRPLTQERESPGTFMDHDGIIDAQLAGVPRGAFVAGHKKDVVVSNKLLENRNRVAIYGWHQPDGKVIQPTYAGHVDWYVDYSHGIRLVRRSMRVHGAARRFEDIMKDVQLRHLISDEGEITRLRYDSKP